MSSDHHLLNEIMFTWDGCPTPEHSNQIRDHARHIPTGRVFRYRYYKWKEVADPLKANKEDK